MHCYLSLSFLFCYSSKFTAVTNVRGAYYLVSSHYRQTTLIFNRLEGDLYFGTSISKYRNP